MDVLRSQIPKPCLSKQDEEYLQRNQKNADRVHFVAMYIMCLVCLFIIGLYISYLRDEWNKPDFNLYIEISHHYGWLLILPIAFFIQNLVDIIIKHKVDALKKKRSKCPKI